MRQVFESERIRFVRISELLVPEYLAMVNDIRNVGRWIGRTDPVTEEEEIRWVRGKLAEEAPIFSMLEKEGGGFIGNVELMDVRDSSGELGIAITASRQELGYGTEAVRAVTGYGMRGLGLNRIFLKARPDNLRAIHVYQKCGFTEFGHTDRDVFLEITGPGPGCRDACRPELPDLLWSFCRS